MQIDKIDLSRVNINDVDNKITSLANVAAKTNIANTFTTNQTIQGQLKLSGTIDNAIKIDKDGAAWYGIYNGNTRRMYFGFPSSNNNMEWKNEMENGNIDLRTTGNDGRIRLYGLTEFGGNVNFGRNTTTFGTDIKLGVGGNPTIQPDDANRDKTLNFRRFNIDVGGKKITNVATPTANNDVATKQYVDSKQSLKKLVIQPKIFQSGREHTLFTPTANQSIVSVNMYRKRTDGWWFNVGGDVYYNQLIRKTPSGPLILYGTQNAQNNITDEYFFEIYYME